MTTSVGIDFGTSNSTVGLAHDNGEVTMVKLEGNSTSIPTCLFFNMEEEGSPSSNGVVGQKNMPVHFGRAAMELYREGYDGRLLRALKSVLGSALAQEGTIIGYKAFRLLDVVDIFFQHLKQHAENAAGSALGEVVIGRPVFFVDDDPAHDKEAEEQLRSVAYSAGFRHVEFQLEPVAAALAYESTLTREELVLIADLGGGTADFSVVRLSPLRHQLSDRSSDILANGGIHIGGTDLDRMLSYKGLMPELGLGTRMRDKPLDMPISPYMTLSTWHKINLLYTPRSRNDIASLQREAAEPDRLEKLLEIIDQRQGHALMQVVEDAKISLTSAAKIVLDAGGIATGLKANISQPQFNGFICDQIGGITRTVREIIKSVGSQKIGTVFFTGGTSMVPAIRNAIIKELPDAQVVDGDPMAAVGKGLAIEAYRRFG